MLVLWRGYCIRHGKFGHRYPRRGAPRPKKKGKKSYKKSQAPYLTPQLECQHEFAARITITASDGKAVTIGDVKRQLWEREGGCKFRPRCSCDHLGSTASWTKPGFYGVCFDC